MPYDNQNNTKSRPLLPTLSATKTTKAPLTPRIVGSPPPHISSSLKQGSVIESEAKPRGCLREDISTPVKAFLSSNITPRSGSRKARVDSTSTTPTGTPNGTPDSSRPNSVVEAPQHTLKDSIGTGLGIIGVGNGRTRRPRSMISEGNSSHLCYRNNSPDSAGYTGYERTVASSESSPMFLYASDARSSVSSQGPSQRSDLERKPAGLINGNGMEVEGSKTISPPHRAATLPFQEEPKSKFFHANGLADSVNVPTKSTKSASELPSASSSRVGTFSPHDKPNPQQRPSSPLKDIRVSRSSSLKKVSPRNYTPLVPNSGVHQIELVSPSGQRASQVPLGRRSSLSTPAARRISHAKSNSISSLDSTPTRRRSLRLPDPTATPTTAAARKTESEVPLEDVSTGSAIAAKENADSISLPQSPTKTAQGQTKLQHMNELAANARRERKVLDLEISNSSLLAINSTLEREMRKQNTELRRFRRLSRSGRLSMATSLRSISAGGLSVLSETDNASDFSELPEEDEIDEFSDDESLLDDGTLSPATYAERDARLRAKDEKRLQLDLSKHQELLIDSQKMNQSIKRCLGWTEELIKDGQKALDYQVRVSDVEVGGRVLTPDEIDADTSHRRGLLSPAHEPGNPLGEDSYLNSMGEDSHLDKVLDGVEVDKDNGIELTQTPDTGDSGGGGGLGLGEYLHSLGESWGI
ncbi:MAG: hypothetical protein M1830_001297 [Pleopsidium flavum]|nr:MAG: hypothetical protein M1830_001297 [Pleopsidium flavum]